MGLAVPARMLGNHLDASAQFSIEQQMADPLVIDSVQIDALRARVVTEIVVARVPFVRRLVGGIRLLVELRGENRHAVHACEVQDDRNVVVLLAFFEYAHLATFGTDRDVHRIVGCIFVGTSGGEFPVADPAIVACRHAVSRHRFEPRLDAGAKREH